MENSYCSLTTEQQGRLMRQINELSHVDGDDRAKEAARELIDFIFALEHHSFITPTVRVKYQSGIDTALERRRKNAENQR